MEKDFLNIAYYFNKI